jgi:hypothetical protein
MNAELASALDDCIERLARGETLQACLARYPQQAGELKACLESAARLGAGSAVRPSAAFKARARSQLTAYMAAHPRPLKIRVPKRRSLFPQLTFGLVLCLIALAITTTALAQSALPGSTLYSLKLSSEKAWQMVAPDPAGVDLILAQRRVDEALAVSGDAKAQGIALDGYQKIIATLAQYKDPVVHQRIETSLKTQQDKLSSAGLSNISPASLTETPATSAAPHTSGGVKGPEKKPTATPIFRIPDIFGH